MTTFALVHGSGDGGWAWHLVQRELRERGHESVAPDLPTDRDDASWDDCVDVVVGALRGAEDVVVVGHSSGGFLAPLVADRVGARLQVFVAGMVPRPDETPTEWFANVAWTASGLDDPYYHDVPAVVAREAMARERPTSERLGETPWPAPALPAIPARYVVTTLDRFLPPAVQRVVAADRLGISKADVVAAGHCVNLSRPEELAALLSGFAEEARGHSASTAPANPSSLPSRWT